MINIKSISLKNFLSIGNATQALRLDEHGLTLVLGNNSDANGGVTKNGAGKTALLQALSFALYGQPLTKIKVDNLINNINGKAMFVVVEFEVNDVPYRVERGRKPNILKVYKNGEELKEEGASDSKGENKETNIDIAALVGMSHTMFKHIVALNTYTDPFLKEGAAKQREFIEELLGVTQISQRADLLKQMIGDTKDEIKSEDATIKATREANARIERAIESADQQATLWESRHTRTVMDLMAQVEAMSSIDFEAEVAKFDALDQWRKKERVLRTDLSYLEKEKAGIVRDIARNTTDHARAVKDAKGVAPAGVDRLVKDIARIRLAISAISDDQANMLAECARVQGLIDNPADQECATCGQGLTGTDHLSHIMTRLNNELVRYTSAAFALDEEVAEKKTAIHDIERDIAEREKEAETLKTAAGDRAAVLEGEQIDLETALAEKVEMIDRVTTDMAALGKQPETLFESRDEVYTAKHARDTLAGDLVREEAAENPFYGQVEGLRQTLQTIDMDPLNAAYDLLKHQELLFKFLTSKDSFIRRKIIEQNLHYLNVRLNYYLNKLGLPHEVVFQSDLSVEITLLGRDFDFAQLSRGESNRVIMATSWAFRDVWESLNTRVNLMWMDELLDNGTDGSGAEQGLQVLKGFGRAGRNIFLVSHRDELVGRIDRTLTVSKENGFTSITEEA